MDKKNHPERVAHDWNKVKTHDEGKRKLKKLSEQHILSYELRSRVEDEPYVPVELPYSSGFFQLN